VAAGPRTGQVGRQEDFSKLGGDSLRAVMLTAKVRARFGYRMPLSMVVANPTVAAMAEVLRMTTGDRPRSPLIPIQRGPYLLAGWSFGGLVAYELAVFQGRVGAAAAYRPAAATGRVHLLRAAATPLAQLSGLPTSVANGLRDPAPGWRGHCGVDLASLSGQGWVEPATAGVA
jgi:aryl carrier-like protein